MSNTTTKKKVTRIIAHLPDGSCSTEDFAIEFYDIYTQREILGDAVLTLTQKGARLEIAVVEVDA